MEDGKDGREGVGKGWKMGGRWCKVGGREWREERGMEGVGKGVEWREERGMGGRKEEGWREGGKGGREWRGGWIGRTYVCMYIYI